MSQLSLKHHFRILFYFYDYFIKFIFKYCLYLPPAVLYNGLRKFEQPVCVLTIFRLYNQVGGVKTCPIF